MTLFQQVNYNPETQTADIGAGRLWQDVYKILPHDRTVAGASSCPGVGVAGFNLGGGYSNKTNQFGLAIDNIQSIDVVVPSGEVLTVCDTSNEDLFWALKVCILNRYN
jgi:FAD/FMN-containing dehydrogenase